MTQTTPKLHTVYDLGDQPALHASFYYIFLIAVFMWAAYFFMRNKSFADPMLVRFQTSSLFIAIFAVLVSIIVGANDLKNYFEIKGDYDNKQYSIVEGRVQDYEAQPRRGSGAASFRVDSLYFSFDGEDASIFSCNKPRTPGGMIRPNLYVRVYYPTYGRICILRLETE